MTSIIAECEEVSKLYGTFAALRKVSVRLERGRCYLVLGENGAGKSTLLRTLAGLLKPSYGKVRVFGADGEAEDPMEARERIGYMSHATMLYDEFSGVENLRYFASLYRGRDCVDAGRGAAQRGARSGAGAAGGAVFAGDEAAGIAGAGADFAAGTAAAG